jgi:site-specific recombinase, phage integrase family
MANLFPTIVPGKILINRTHKIRIALSHNGETRYIVTDIIVDSEKEFRNGVVVKRPDALYLNTKLRKLIDKYQKTLDIIDCQECMTCSQLLDAIKGAKKSKYLTMEQLYEEYKETHSLSQGSITAYDKAMQNIHEYIGKDVLVNNITYHTIITMESKLRAKGLRSDTIRIRLSAVRALMRFALQCHFITYDTYPFERYKMPDKSIRDIWLTVDEIKKIRDSEFTKEHLIRTRDLFMLSYYLGGINIADLAEYNFLSCNNKMIYYRKKVMRDNKTIAPIEFDIPVEAKWIINHYLKKDGTIQFQSRNSKQNTKNIYSNINRNLKTIQKEVGITKTLMYYSARKSFAQHAFELGISTITIDYLIGHSVASSAKGSIYHYVKATPEIANEALRTILDNLK